MNTMAVYVLITLPCEQATSEEKIEGTLSNALFALPFPLIKVKHVGPTFKLEGSEEL